MSTMRWMWAIILAGYLATASAALSGAMAEPVAHVHGASQAMLSTLSVASSDSCHAQTGAMSDTHRTCCCDGLVCSGAALDKVSSLIVISHRDATRHCPADDLARGRDIQPETGPPRVSV
jgi:hypothetical protein